MRVRVHRVTQAPAAGVLPALLLPRVFIIAITSFLIGCAAPVLGVYALTSCGSTKASSSAVSTWRGFRTGCG